MAKLSKWSPIRSKNHEFHAGEEFASLSGIDFGDDAGYAGVNLDVEGIEFALAPAYRIEQRAGARSHAFSGGSGGLFRHVAGFHGATDKITMNRFSVGNFECGAHERSPSGRGTMMDDSGTIAAIQPFVGLNG